MSGPNDQIFLALSSSIPNSFLSCFALIFGSSLNLIFPSSIASAKPCFKGSAKQYIRLCLFGDLEIQTEFNSGFDTPNTVSR
mmetsp:Transcript_58690/g.155199  ORF Transcript_58690/g.155199 Transcript_58690/m.155199 type:complete len:82 (-) Transcript_58690:2328-2573(-)